MKTRIKIFLASIFLFTAMANAWGQSTWAEQEKVVAGVVSAAEHALDSLNEAQRKAAMFAFSDDAQRRRWSNLPTGIYERAGVRMGDLNQDQRAAIMGLIGATFSERGYQQIVDNINAEELLNDPNSSGRLKFGKDEMYFSILGKPSSTDPWMWQFGGHHLAINATIAGSRITLSPTLTGGQPMNYTLNGKSVNLLDSESKLAGKLIRSLTTEQMKLAVLGEKYIGMAYGPTARDIQPKPEGIPGEDLSAEQRQLLIDLIEERIGILKAAQAETVMEKVKQNISKTYFSWFGPTEAGSSATFRIQGPTVLIEYCPQSLGGDPSNHNHAMYRDPTNDYGDAYIGDLK